MPYLNCFKRWRALATCRNLFPYLVNILALLMIKEIIAVAPSVPMWPLDHRRKLMAWNDLLLKSHIGFHPLLCALQVDANWLMLSSIFSLILKLSWQVYNYQDCPFSLFKKMSTSFTLFQSTGTFFILLSSQK